MVLSKPHSSSNRIYYGWWIVLAAFLNLLFVVGILFYGFPVFYPYYVESLGFTRAQVTQGFLLGFLFAGLPFGIVAGTLIDRIGARLVILAGVALVGLPLLLMGSMSHFWQFELVPGELVRVSTFNAMSHYTEAKQQFAKPRVRFSTAINGRATIVIRDPISEIVWPIHSFRKSRSRHRLGGCEGMLDRMAHKGAIA